MSIFDPSFWPWFWALIVSGAILTAVLCLVAGLVAAHRVDRRATGTAAHDRAPEAVTDEHHSPALR